MNVNSQKPVIFVSHCWEDNDEKSISFKNKIVSYLENKANIIYDKSENEENFRFGADLDKEMMKLKTSDSILIFLSKKYIKASTDINRGVYKETLEINKIKEENSKRNSYSELPIFIITLDNIKNIEEFTRTRTIYFDISPYGLNADNYINIIERKCAEIIRRAKLFFQQRDKIFQNQFEMRFKLWFTNKANLRDSLPRECVVTTKAYDKIFRQFSSVIIGRKGSGKSTFYESLRSHPYFNFYNKYKICIPIKADAFFLESFYDRYKQNLNDISIIERDRFIDQYWKFYFCIHSFYTICIEYISDNIVDTNQKNDVKKIYERMCEVFNLDSLENVDYGGISIAITELFFNFLNGNILDYVKNMSSFEVALITNFNYLNIIESIFKKENKDLFKLIMDKCKKRIYIYLDAFDVYSEDFRNTTKSVYEKDPNEGKRRMEFEAFFFRQLILTVENIKENDYPFLNHLDFCIIYSKDRVEQVRLIDRDFSKRKVVDLQWSAKELLELLIRRFCVSIQVEYKDNEEKLNQMWEIKQNNSINKLEKCEKLLLLYCPNIDSDINVKTKSTIKKMEIIKYILSVSFWRPRDIIWYMAQIITASMSSSFEKIDSDIIKELLDEKTIYIIENEFISEYQNIILNIRDLINSLRGLNAIYNLKRFLEILNGISIKLGIIDEVRDNKEKFAIMYELGMVGIIIRHEKKQIRYNFIYNEGLQPLEQALKFNEDFQIVINPLFYKFCNIKYNVDYLICDFDLKYLDYNDMKM